MQVRARSHSYPLTQAAQVHAKQGRSIEVGTPAHVKTSALDWMPTHPGQGPALRSRSMSLPSANLLAGRPEETSVRDLKHIAPGGNEAAFSNLQGETEPGAASLHLEAGPGELGEFSDSTGVGETGETGETTESATPTPTPKPADAKATPPAAAPPTPRRSRLDGQLQLRLAGMMVDTPKLRERYIDAVLSAHVPHDKDAVGDLMKMAFRKLQGAPAGSSLASRILKGETTQRDAFLAAIAAGVKSGRIDEKAHKLLLQGLLEAVHFEDVQASASRRSDVKWDAALAASPSDAAKARFIAVAEAAGAKGEVITEILNSRPQPPAANGANPPMAGHPQAQAGAAAAVADPAAQFGEGDPLHADADTFEQMEGGTTGETGTYARLSESPDTDLADADAALETETETGSDTGAASVEGAPNPGAQPPRLAAPYVGPLCRPAGAKDRLFEEGTNPTEKQVFEALLGAGEGTKSRLAQLRESIFGPKEVDIEALLGDRDKPWNNRNDLTADVEWSWNLRWEGKNFGWKLANALESLVPDGEVVFEAGEISKERKKALEFNAAMQALLADAAFQLGKSVDETFKAMMVHVANEPNSVDPVAFEHLSMAAATMIVGTSPVTDVRTPPGAERPVLTHARVAKYLGAIEPLFADPRHRASARIAINALEVSLSHWHSSTKDRSLQDAYRQVSQRVNRTNIQLTAAELAEVDRLHPLQNGVESDARRRALEEKREAARAELKDAMFNLRRLRDEPLVDGSPAPASHSREFDELQGDATPAKRLATVMRHTGDLDAQATASYLVDMSARARERGEAKEWCTLVTAFLAGKAPAEAQALVPAMLHAVDYAQASAGRLPDLDLVRTVADHVGRSNELRTLLANDAGIRELTSDPQSKVGAAYAEALALAPLPVIPRPAAQPAPAPAPAGQPLPAAQRAAVDRFNEEFRGLGGVEL